MAEADIMPIEAMDDKRIPSRAGEKLRAAREAAAQAVAPVRKPRERKPLPQQADEPLVQVNTQRN